MFVLENWLFVKMGDWSYVWYLVHWPIIEFWLYWSPDGVMHAKGKKRNAIIDDEVIACFQMV